MRYQTRSYVEGSLDIDIRRYGKTLAQGGGKFVATWKRGDRVTGQVLLTLSRQSAKLRYRYSSLGDQGRLIDQSVPITWTPCHLGGERPWFFCSCGRRVAIIYGAGPRFACRACSNLHYTTQSEDPKWRWLRRARRIRAKLGAEPLTLIPLIPKPKGMRWKTFHRLIAELHVVEGAALSALQAYSNRLRDRLS